METKKSFLLYFDMYPQLVDLSPEQRGQLLSALFEYALNEAEVPGSGADVPDRYPAMAPDTRMAFRFMAESIRRDTEKWFQKHLRYQEAARERNSRRWAQELDEVYDRATGKTP